MLIVLVVFTSTTGLLLALMSSEQAEYEEDPDSVWTLIHGESYTICEPVAGRPVTWVNATDNYYNARTDETDATHFYVAGDSNPIRVSVIRNLTDSQGWFQYDGWFQYADFLAVEKSWGWFDWAAAPVPYTGITAAHNLSSASDTVYYNITLDRDYVLIISTATAGGFSDSLWDNNTFTIKLAVPSIDPDVLDPSGSWWDIVWNFLSAIGALLFGYSMPGVPYLGAVLSLAIWVGIFYVAYMIIVRGIHGG